MPQASAQIAVTKAVGLKAASKPVETRRNVNRPLASHGNVRKLSEVTLQKGTQQQTVAYENTKARKPTSRPPVSLITDRPLTTSKSVSGCQSVAVGKKSSASQGGCLLNCRRSYTSQFITDQRRTVQRPAAVTQPKTQSAADCRTSYHTQLEAKQKTAIHAQNCLSRLDSSKTSGAQVNCKKKADVEAHHRQSCHDRRKSYHAELVGRRRTALAASKKPAPRRSDVGLMKTSSSKLAAENPRISTPFSNRRTVATTTPSLSCIPPRKTVSFFTPSTSHKTTPRLHRTQPVSKEMSIR